MARYENGWIKLSRRAVIEDIGDNVFALGLWVMLLSLATWKETKIIWNGKQRKLPPGSVVFGITEFAERWNCSKSTISKWLTYLHKTERIILESSTRGSIATICNWEKYQASETEVRTPTGHQLDTARTPSEHGANVNEEGKNVRREEGTLTHEIATACISEWETTLKHFEISRSIGSQDEIKIARAIQRFGAEWVKLALQGARKQTASKTWNPRDFVSLDIYFDPRRIERLVNIAAGKESADGIDWSKVWGAA